MDRLRYHPYVPIGHYFDVRSRTEIDTTTQRVTPDDVSHYHIFLVKLMLRNIAHYKEPHVHALLYELDCHVHQIDKSESDRYVVPNPRDACAVVTRASPDTVGCDRVPLV